MEKTTKAIAKLAKDIANSNIEQQVSLLPQALDYGDLGIDFLIDRLDDPELEIRAKAYELLQPNQSQKVQKAIALGLLINPGDKIYYIQQGTMWFNDRCYSLSASEDSVKYLETQDDYRNQGYKIVRFDQEAYIISWSLGYINYEQARVRATSLQNEIILKHSITEFDIEDDHKVIEQWCNLHEITTEVRELQTENTSLSDIYWFTVEKYLKSTGNLDLLNQLWLDLVGSFTSICEKNFVKKTYLTIDPYYSQIPEQENYYSGSQITKVH
jgi:hypothetical protein